MTNDGEKSRSQSWLKNGMPQGFVLAPTLCKIYTSDFSTTVADRYLYADGIAQTIAAPTSK